MRSIFNNSVTRIVRDEVNDIRRKNREMGGNLSSTSGTYNQYPPSTSSTADSYSHTANSTAGYSQSRAYPTLTNFNQDRDRSVRNHELCFLIVVSFLFKTIQSILTRAESKATSLVANVVGDDTIALATHKLNHAMTNGSNTRVDN
jgi:hypothetical protein